jgi:5-methylcytosine-specific restriction endonuclease McrA
MSDYIPLQLRRWLETLGERCEYCQTSEFVTGVALEADHIWPRSLQGPTSRENLCRACSSCNTQKNDRVEALDPLTEERVALCNRDNSVGQNIFVGVEMVLRS